MTVACSYLVRPKVQPHNLKFEVSLAQTWKSTSIKYGVFQSSKEASPLSKEAKTVQLGSSFHLTKHPLVSSVVPLVFPGCSCSVIRLIHFKAFKSERYFPRSAQRRETGKSYFTEFPSSDGKLKSLLILAHSAACQTKRLLHKCLKLTKIRQHFKVHLEKNIYIYLQ